MLAKRITRVSLARTSQPVDSDERTYPDSEGWLLEWKVAGGDRRRHSHYTETAARTHVRNLLVELADGVTVEDAYSESV